MKKCKGCGKEKELSDYYMSHHGKYYFTKCKDCMKSYSLKYYNENSDSQNKVACKYKKSETGLANARKSNNLSYKKHLYKYKTRYMIKELVRKGIIKRLSCEACGSPLSEAHHPDYTNPYLVVWLCRKHHREIDCLFKHCLTKQSPPPNKGE